MTTRESREVPAAWVPVLKAFRERREAALAGGGSDRIAREHSLGRLSARERITLLVDEDSFDEYGTFSTTPSETGQDRPTTFICGTARIDGRPVALGVEDFTVEGGGVGVHLARIKGGWGGFIEELALAYRLPLVLLLQGVGGSIRLQEVKGFPQLLAGMSAFPIVELLSHVPVAAAVLGPAAGGSAARAALAHFSVMAEQNGCLFAGGPRLVKQALGLEIDKMELGGADVHVRQSGVIDNVAVDEEDAIDQLRIFLSYLPSSAWSLPPLVPTGDPVDRPIDEVLDVVTPDARQPFDVEALIHAIVDRESFFEQSREYGPSLRTGLARIDGHSVGVLATDAAHSGGALDVAASEKQVRFVEMCNAFHIPLVYFVDVPGFMIGPEAERQGILRKGSRAVYAIQSATVPVYTIQVRRSYGLAGQATGSANPWSVRLAWPSGAWGDMPLEGGIEASHRAVIEAADDPAAFRRELLARYEAQSSPWRAVERFGVEEMIDPRDTRMRLAELLALARQATTPAPKSGAAVRP